MFNLKHCVKFFRHFIALLSVLAVFANTALATTFTVNTTSDVGDDTPDGFCDNSGFCSLREAIDEADASAVDADIVDFSLTEGTVIPISSTLRITKGNFTIQNSSDNTIGIDGQDGAYSGFIIEGDGFTIDGDADGGGDADPALYIYNFGWNGIDVDSSAEETQIKDVVIGFTPTGIDSGNGDKGIKVRGDDTLIDGVVVSNNTYSGIEIQADTATDVIVSNSKLGTNIAGTADKGNGYGGVDVSCTTCDGGSVNGDAGGSGGEGITITDNLLSGNGASGIRAYTNDGTTGNIAITDNIIGLDVNGEDGSMGNTGPGIDGYEGVKVDYVVSGNTISDNTGPGINILDGTSLTVDDNIIGWDDEGVTAVGNGGSGIKADATTVTITGNSIGNNSNNGIEIPSADEDAISLIIGGSTATAYNVIGNNDYSGIVISGDQDATILGNYIGVDDDGTTDIGNTNSGISISGSGTITIGGGGATDGNVIGYNGYHGIGITGDSDVTISGNYIGISSDGTTDIGNTHNGIYIDGGDGPITIGGDNSFEADGTLGEGNVISNNVNGISVRSGGDILTILGNIIGLKKGVSTDYDTASGNSGYGIYVNSSDLSNLTIGGVGSTYASSKRNIISGNTSNGIKINSLSSSAVGNIINNYIGLDINGSAVVANLQGIEVGSGVNGASVVLNIGGTGTNQGNVIAGNTQSNIYFYNTAGTVNVLGNKIGVNPAATSAFTNAGSGINISGDGTYNIGNGSFGGGNVVSGHTNSGLYVSSDSSGTVSIKGNIIGLLYDLVELAYTTAAGNGSATLIPGLNYSGIQIIGAGGTDITIGGGDYTDANKRNVISGNYGAGILSAVSDGLVIAGNLIGLGSDGEDHDVGNVESEDRGVGIHLYNYSDVDGTIIGGDSALAGNLIAGNEGDGLWLDADDGTGSMDFTGGKIAYNILGKDINGASVPNDSNSDGNEYGITIQDTMTHISALQIVNNTLNTISNYGIWLYDVLSTSLYNSVYSYIPQNNTFSNPASYTWQYYLDGVEQIFGQCYDGYDNNSDGDIDSADVGCAYSPFIEGDTSGDPVAAGQGAPLSLSYSGSNSQNNNEEEDDDDIDVDVDANANVDVDVDADVDVAGENAQNEENPSAEQASSNEEDQLQESELSAEEIDAALEALEGDDQQVEIPEDLQEYVDFGQEIADALADFENLSEEVIDILAEEASAMANQSLQDAIAQNVAQGGSGSVTINLGRGSSLEVNASNIDKIAFVPNYLSEKKKEEMLEKAKEEGKIVVEYGSGTDIGGDGVDDAVQDLFGLPQVGADEIDDDNCDLACEIWANKNPLKKDDPKKSVLAIGSTFMQKEATTPVVGKDFIVRINFGNEVTENDEIAFILYNEKGEEIKKETIKFTDINAVFVLKDNENGIYHGALEINGELVDAYEFEVNDGNAENLKVKKFDFLRKDAVSIGDPPEYMPKPLTEGLLAGLKASVIDTDFHRVAVKAEDKVVESENVSTPDFVGYAKPGSIVIATWQSRILSSTVLADASQGEFELYMPEALPYGDHEILVFVYDPSRSLVSNVTSLLFRK